MDPFILSFMLFTTFVVAVMGTVCWAALTYKAPPVIVIDDQAGDDDDDDDDSGGIERPEEPDEPGPGHPVDWEGFDRERSEWNLARF